MDLKDGKPKTPNARIPASARAAALSAENARTRIGTQRSVESASEDWPMRRTVQEINEDAIHILSFRLFLDSGEWKEDESGRTFVVDQTSYEYATGKIDAQAYLNSADPAKLEALIEKYPF